MFIVCNTEDAHDDQGDAEYGHSCQSFFQKQVGDNEGKYGRRIDESGHGYYGRHIIQKDMKYAVRKDMKYAVRKNLTDVYAYFVYIFVYSFYFFGYNHLLLFLHNSEDKNLGTGTSA